MIQSPTCRHIVNPWLVDHLFECPLLQQTCFLADLKVYVTANDCVKQRCSDTTRRRSRRELWAQNDTTYKRWNYHIRFDKLLCLLCRYLPPQQWGSHSQFLGQACHAEPLHGWLAPLLIHAGVNTRSDNHTNKSDLRCLPHRVGNRDR